LQRGLRILDQVKWKLAKLQQRRLRWAVIRTQAFRRGIVAQRHLLFLRRTKAATMLQSAWRGGVCRSTYQLQRGSLIRVQATYRAKLQQRADRRLRWAIIRTQAFRRGIVAQRHLLFLRRTKAATMLQSAWRGGVCRSTYQLQRGSLIRVQATYRAKLQQRVYQRLRQGVIRIQTLRRGILEQRPLLFGRRTKASSLPILTPPQLSRAHTRGWGGGHPQWTLMLNWILPAPGPNRIFTH
jgi:hypothetical protein